MGPEHFPLGYRERAIREFSNGPYSFIRHEQFANAAPEPHEIRPGADPQRMISDCRPEGEVPDYGPDLIEYGIEWYARWGPRVMYDKSLREEVLAEAERIFERQR